MEFCQSFGLKNRLPQTKELCQKVYAPCNRRAYFFGWDYKKVKESIEGFWSYLMEGKGRSVIKCEGLFGFPKGDCLKEFDI